MPAIEPVIGGVDDQRFTDEVERYAPHHPFDPPEEALAPFLDRLNDLPLPVARDDDLASKTEYQRVDAEGAYGQIGGWLGGYGRHEMTDLDHRMVKAAYWAMCEHVDKQVGRMLAALEASGQADNTIVVFMSDHGEMLGDHNIYLKSPYFYDAAIRVPLIVRYPGRVRPARISEPVELVDLAPTLLELTGTPIYPGMQGRSRAAALTGTESGPAESDIYCEYYNAMPYHRNPTAQLTMLRTRTHKIVVDHAYDDGELYDLEADPLEQDNLWLQSAALPLKADLLRRLTHRMAFTADPLPLRLSEW